MGSLYGFGRSGRRRYLSQTAGEARARRQLWGVAIQGPSRAPAVLGRKHHEAPRQARQFFNRTGLILNPTRGTA
jgi:hypothetical protein